MEYCATDRPDLRAALGLALADTRCCSGRIRATAVGGPNTLRDAGSSRRNPRASGCPAVSRLTDRADVQTPVATCEALAPVIAADRRVRRGSRAAAPVGQAGHGLTAPPCWLGPGGGCMVCSPPDGQRGGLPSRRPA